MASNPGTDKSHRDKVERCFKDGLNKPADPGPIDDAHSIDYDFGGDDEGEQDAARRTRQVAGWLE